MKDPFFVVTSGRSGSLSLALTLSQHPFICALHEPLRRLVPMAYAQVTGIPTEYSGVSLARWFKNTIPHPPGPQLAGVVDHKLTHFIPELAEAFPESKFIWLVRDGRKVVRSCVARGWYGPQEAAVDGNIWQTYRIPADRAEVMSAGEWSRLGQFERCCWYWQWINKEIRQGLGGLAEERSELYLLEELDGELGAIQQFLGMVGPVPLTLYHANQGPRTPETDWTDDEKRIFAEFCGDAMDGLYPDWEVEDA
jgi:hypothetical protein